MKINKVGIIGLGALGTMYGKLFTDKLGKDSVFIMANSSRIEKYKKEGVYSNNKLCDFSYVNTEDKGEPFDLVIFAVKYNALPKAIEDAKNYIGDKTIILSVLNGITSEEVIGKVYGKEKMLYCTVQGMDAVKIKNKLTYYNIGSITFGEKDNSMSEKVKALSKLLDKVNIPYEIPDNIMNKLWSKLMLNTGVNQAVAVFETNYGGVQKEGKPREVMIGAMKEVFEIAKKENIIMEDNEIEKWLKILDTLNKDAKPSLRQDTEAKRKTEVDLFGGTIIKLGKKHKIETPYNDFLYNKIKEIEESYSN
ncbi:MAG: ketopantoate reductase family protein [Clostridiales bacterium]|nr:ketopantoate reductase family protein [Clostridiales bacterium]